MFVSDSLMRVCMYPHMRALMCLCFHACVLVCVCVCVLYVCVFSMCAPICSQFYVIICVPTIKKIQPFKIPAFNFKRICGADSGDKKECSMP